MTSQVAAAAPSPGQVRLPPRYFAGLLALAVAGCAEISVPFMDRQPPQPSSAALPRTALPAAAAAVALAETGAGAEAQDPAYRLGPEDGLEITVWREDTLKSTVLVRPDGGISFPLAGDFIVSGKTAAEVREELIKRLQKYVPDPVVTVTVVRVASYRIYVLGRVNKPGDIVLGRSVDVLQALSMAGGMTPFANEDDIRIIRRVDGKNVSIPFQYSRVRKGGDLSQNITLLRGDVLLVP